MMKLFTVQTAYNKLAALLLLTTAAGAQTVSQTTAVTQSLSTIANHAQSTWNMMNATTRPANWADILRGDMDAVIAAAAAAKAAATTTGTTNTSTPTTTTGRTVNVPSGGNLQIALDNAQPGDTIVLQAGGVYAGRFLFRAKPASTQYITIISSALGSLPAGKRVGPAQTSLMPKLIGNTESGVIIFESGAHHYRLAGLNIEAKAGLYNNALVQIGANETSVGRLPSDIELDRVYIHAGSPGWAKRGINMNGVRVKLTNSYLSGFRSNWQETQAICAWNTPGPLTITNNYLEAAGMPIMIGGSEPGIAGVTPSDILITGNFITRPAAWRWETLIVKNLLELKTGRRVTITGNLFENHWRASQSGYAINLKPGSENIKTPAITTEVLFANNILRHVNAGVTISGTNSYRGKLSKVTLRNNLFEDLGSKWGASHTLFGIFYGASDITIEHNTAAPSAEYTRMLLTELPASPGLKFRGNLVRRGSSSGVSGGGGEGTKTLTTVFTPVEFFGNVIYASPANLAGAYPAGNYFPVTSTEISWTNLTAGTFSLSAGTYKGIVAGKDPGVDWAALQAATARARTGQ